MTYFKYGWCIFQQAASIWCNHTRSYIFKMFGIWWYMTPPVWLTFNVYDCNEFSPQVINCIIDIEINIQLCLVMLSAQSLTFRWYLISQIDIYSLQWRHNERDGVSNHQLHDCLLNRLFRRRSKKTSNLRVSGLCMGNSPVTGEFPAQMASYAENVSIWWRHHV